MMVQLGLLLQVGQHIKVLPDALSEGNATVSDCETQDKYQRVLTSFLPANTPKPLSLEALFLPGVLLKSYLPAISSA